MAAGRFCKLSPVEPNRNPLAMDDLPSGPSDAPAKAAERQAASRTSRAQTTAGTVGTAIRPGALHSFLGIESRSAGGLG